MTRVDGPHAAGRRVTGCLPQRARARDAGHATAAYISTSAGKSGATSNRRAGATEESAEPAPPSPVKCAASARASHLFGKIALGCVDALDPEHARLVLTCKTHRIIDHNSRPRIR